MSPKPRAKKITIRLHDQTLKDISDIAYMLQDTRTAAVRFLLSRGFSALGNWRASELISINGRKTFVPRSQ